MNYSTILHHLQGLFQHPHQEWEEINKNYHESIFILLKRFFFIFYIIYPIVFSLRMLLHYPGLKNFIFFGTITPILVLTFYLLVMYLISIIIEETADFFGGSISSVAGAKIAYFSSLPVLSFGVLSAIPKVGFIFLFIGLVYQLYLIYISGKTLLNISPVKRGIWFTSIFISLYLFLFVVYLIIFLSSIFLNIVAF